MMEAATRYTSLLASLLLLAASMRLNAQDAAASDTIRPRYGIFGGYAANMHTADFRALPGVPNCCPIFESGSGSAPFGGFLYETPLARWLLLSLRAGYVVHDATLSEREPVTVIVDGTARDGAFEHTVDASIASLGLEPSLGIRLFGGAYLNVGLRGAAYLTQRYSQEERIVDPVDVGTYLNPDGTDSRSRVRNASEGELPEKGSLLMQGIAGLSYELPLNSRGTLLLVPEVSYALSFTDVVRGIDWKANGLRAGIALKYSPAPVPPKPVRHDTVVVRDTASLSAPVNERRLTLLSRGSDTRELEGPDTIVVRTTVTEHYKLETPLQPPITCGLTAVGIDDDGHESPAATLKIEEFLSTVAHPLLNYVFFDRGSSQLASRYVRLTPEETSRFRAEDLYGSGTLPVYYTMLNIIGSRMRAMPKAVLTLTGCNMDQEEEKGNLELSRGRAEAVRSYLMSAWGIDGGRLKVEATNLPAKKSNPLTPDGQAEDRRVEIASNMPEVLDVLMLNDTTRVSVPPLVRLAPAITSPEGVAAWEVTVTQRGATLKRFNGSGAPPTSLDWDLANDQRSVPRFDDPVEITLTASSPDGQSTTCRITLPTQVTTLRQKRENRAGDYTIDRYNLILFNVGESGITSTNQRIIDLVKSRLKPGSELTIEGFADRTGNAASNQRLSASRAQMTAGSLGRADAVTRGIGESRLLHPNDTPEGRFYCRTVQISVKTPR
jgi:outer membrane protein OmpA-like peptidoglycan-associated protein